MPIVAGNRYWSRAQVQWAVHTHNHDPELISNIQPNVVTDVEIGTDNVPAGSAAGDAFGSSTASATTAYTAGAVGTSTGKGSAFGIRPNLSRQYVVAGEGGPAIVQEEGGSRGYVVNDVGVYETIVGLKTGAGSAAGTGAASAVGTSLIPGAGWTTSRTGFTYTNGGRTATASFTSFTDTVTKHNAVDGKLYLEVAIGQAGAGSSFFYFGDPTIEPLNIFDSGTVSDNNFSPIGTYDGFVTGDTLAVAIDLTNRLAWFRTKHAGSFGNWNASGTANPATGVGGISFASFTGPLAFGYNPSNTGDQATINTGTVTFAQAMPSGFSAWFSTDNFVTGVGTAAGTGSATAICPFDEFSTTAGDAAQFNFSNTNRTAALKVAQTNKTVRSFFSNASGKFRATFTMGTVSHTSDSINIGIWDGVAEGSGFPSNAVWYDIFSGAMGDTNAGTVATGPTATTGDVVDYEVDLTNKLVWVRVNGGNWNNSGTANPATGTGGISYSAVTLTQAYLFVYIGDAGNGTTLNTGTTTFANPSSSGFNNWYGTVAGITTGAGSASGVGAATAIGAATDTSTGTSAGTGVASGVGKSTAAATGTASGIGAASAAGIAIFTTVGTATGTGAATTIGTATDASIGSASGSSAGSGVGKSTAASAGTSAGTGSALGVGKSTAASTGTSAGTGSASGTATATAASVGTASGTGAASGMGVSTATSVGTTAGTSTASAVGVNGAGNVGSAAGTSTVSGVGRSTAVSTGTSTGTGTASAVGASSAKSVGTSAGTSTASGTFAATGRAVGTSTGTATASGFSSGSASGTGSSAGTSTVSGIGRSTAASTGSCASIATASAVGVGVVLTVGTSAGTSTAAGTLTATARSAGTSAGTSVATAFSTGTAGATGSSAGTSTAIGVAKGIGNTVGTSHGLSTAAGVAITIAAAIGTATGSSTGSGVGAETARVVGTAPGHSTATAIGVGLVTLVAIGTAHGSSTVVGIGFAKIPPKAAPINVSVGERSNPHIAIGHQQGVVVRTGTTKPSKIKIS